MKEDRKAEAELSIKLATKIIRSLEESNCKREVAYAALGNAFIRIHLGLGKNKEDWLEITKIMGNLLTDSHS